MTSRQKPKPTGTVKPRPVQTPPEPARRKPADTRSRTPILTRQVIWLSAILAAFIVFVYAPVLHHDFISLDDPMYVTENPHIAAGVTPQGITWAFTAGYAGNWHPLTWLSHMLDIQFFGLDPGGHHFTNLFLHIINSILLLFFLFRATGAIGPSAFAAALFAVHPAHVESVAWVAERKDVLSTFFCILTLWVYVEYVRRPERKALVALLVLYVLGLMAKPMLVTLPLILLLLDVWPLRRFKTEVLVEKVPLFALAGVSSVITFFVQRQSGFVQGLGGLPLGSRIANAFVSYVGYIVTLVWPARLAVYYPYSLVIPAWKVITSVLILIGLTALVLRSLKNHPYCAVGWFWYVITLVPVIGFVQVGEQSMADRYTYIPSIGLFIIVTWGAEDLLARSRQMQLALAGAGTLAVALFAVSARNQVQYWQNGTTLWTRTLAVTSGNYVGHNQLAYNLRQAGKRTEAVAEYNEALRLNPEFALAHEGLGVTLSEQGNYEEAIRQLNEAIRLLAPADVDARKNAELGLLQAHHKLALGLAGRSKFEEAVVHLNEVLRIKPDYPEAHNNLGFALSSLGRSDAAAVQFAEALKLKPDLYNAHFGLASVLATQGRIDDAIRESSEALRIKPDYADAQRQLDSLRRLSGKN